MSESPLDGVLRGLAESYQSVKFGSGVVGKTSYAAIALLVIWAGIVAKMGDNIATNVALFIAGLVPTGIFLWWVSKTHKFATDNPAQALLEGAQLLEYKKFDAQVKGLVVPAATLAIQDPHPPKITDQVEGNGE